MSPQIKKVLLTILGIFFLVVGIIGLALPFLQGFLFIAIGLVLLSIVSKRIGQYTESHTRKYPKIHTFIVKMQTRVARIIGEPPPSF